MHYSISNHNDDFPYLVVQPRRKSLKHILLKVEQGMALLKFGKVEYVIERGQTVWIPFDSLCALTFFPRTQVQRVEVSSRVSALLPQKGGYVQLNELTTAILNRLLDSQQSHKSQQKLLVVLLDDLVTLDPKLMESKLTAYLKQWSPSISDNKLLAEQHLALKLREATKRMQSGVKRSKVIADLFENNHFVFTQLEQSILGYTSAESS
ncbi:AraC family transcriptional regulator [Vibrio pectenicida]|uniref:AraC family transcriptional regulator n=1 Tax=Vibrio pectenicida TaxID=62763 RepID=UPI001C11D120|nr:AraC family transcriptional regulator [Vibrio pectenicida]